MYVFYEHFKDANGKIVMTEIKLSSSINRWFISFKNSVENLQFELSKKVMKDSVPISHRTYDPDTKIWSYLPPYGESVLKGIETATSICGGAILQEVEELQDLARQSYFDLSKRKKAIKTEDFFYNHGTIPAQPALTKEQVASKLASIFGVSSLPSEAGALKKLYRQAAMRLHPDRNNGDGSQMSDLNMLWGFYNT